MSLIEDIQAAAISESGDVSALLRKCKLLAARLDASELAQWVDHELTGYPKDAVLPPYRIINGAKSYGHFVGNFSQASMLQISLAVIPDEAVRESFRHVRLGGAISAYQSLLVQPSGNARIPWPVSLAVHYASKLTPGMQCIEAWIEIPRPVLHQMIDSVKTAVLGFAIGIQRESPNAGESPIGGPRPIPEERVTQIFNTNIAGSVGNVANGSSDFRQLAIVNDKVNDWDCLVEGLRSAGIADEATPALKAELDDLRDDASDARLSKGRALFARLVGKAATSGTAVAVEVAATSIAKAIAGYLGFPIG